MHTTVYVLGNPLIKSDNKIYQLLPQLKKHFPDITFKVYDPTEEISLESGELIFIDAVDGISKVTVFDHLEYFSLSPRISVHDYDLPLQLGLLFKLGKIKKVRIIGLPQKGNKGRMLKETITILRAI